MVSVLHRLHLWRVQDHLALVDLGQRGLGLVGGLPLPMLNVRVGNLNLVDRMDLEKLDLDLHVQIRQLPTVQLDLSLHSMFYNQFNHSPL